MGEDIGDKVDKTTSAIRVTSIGITFLHLGQGLIDFIDASDLTHEEATALKEKYGKEYDIEIGLKSTSKPRDSYVLHARRKT